MKNNNNNDKSIRSIQNTKNIQNISKMQDTKNKSLVILRRAFLAILGLLLGVILYFANAQGILGNQLPMPFGYGIANVLSGSMEPTFSKGTLLLAKETSNIKEGDIVVYQSGNSLIVHRVIQIEGNEVTTQGDANNTPDPVFQKDQIKGVVTGWLPYVGNIADFMKTPAGIVILLLLAFWLVEGSFRKEKEEKDMELEDIKKEIRRLRQEIENDEEKKKLQ